MIKILDGPAEGVTLSVSRAPGMLRVVFGMSSHEWDVLNELDDVAEDDETIYVYEMDPSTFYRYHVRPGGWKQGGSYKQIELDG